MRTLLIILVLAGLVTSVSHGDWAAQSDARGKHYEFLITNTDISKSPVWRETDEYPPLGARKAMQLARAELARLLPDAKDWELTDLKLMPWPDRADSPHWMYDIRFTFSRPGFGTYSPEEIHIPVLMNGVVIHATVTPSEK